MLRGVQALRFLHMVCLRLMRLLCLLLATPPPTPFQVSSVQYFSSHWLSVWRVPGGGLWQGCHAYHLPWRWLPSRPATFNAPTLHHSSIGNEFKVYTGTVQSAVVWLRYCTARWDLGKIVKMKSWVITDRWSLNPHQQMGKSYYKPHGIVHRCGTTPFLLLRIIPQNSENATKSHTIWWNSEQWMTWRSPCGTCSNILIYFIQ